MLLNFKYFLCVCFILISLLSKSQSITGTTGLVHTPTAEILNDRELVLGVSYFNKNSQEYTDGRYEFLGFYGSMAFLPFLELTYRLNIMPEVYGKGSHVMDRMPSARIRLLKEHKFIPALTVGVHDFAKSTSDATTVHFNSLYIVGSKNFCMFSSEKNVGVHLGYGSDILSAKHYQFVGIFGGISVKATKNIKAMIEYDTERINCGMQLTLLNMFDVILGLEDFKSFSASVCWKYLL